METSLSDILQAIIDPAYWLAMNPGFSIRERSSLVPLSFDPNSLDEIRRNVAHEGYFQIDDVLSGHEVRQLASSIVRLHEQKCPIVFAFVYDEFWNVCRKLSPVLSGVLSEPYRQLPDFWVWLIDPKSQSAGWKPHRDKGFKSLNADGSPKSLTIWVPLTDAIPLNGCMYVVPSYLDPPSRYIDREDTRMPQNLQDIRALPIRAGSVLGWNQAVLHWGGRASQLATTPRISFACEFQRSDIPAYNEPLLDPKQPPPFQQRLRLIGKQILQYRHMYEYSERLIDIGEFLSKLSF
jgi:hypothetical protein